MFIATRMAYMDQPSSSENEERARSTGHMGCEDFEVYKEITVKWKIFLSGLLMKNVAMDSTLVVFVSLLVCGSAAPQYGGEHEYHHQHHEVHAVDLHTTPIPILSHKSEIHKEGYKFSYKTGNGIHAEESGYIKKTGEKEDDDVIVMHGSVSYTGPDGTPIKLTYVADEHGFQPQGAHLPTPVPLPLELQKAYEEAYQQHQHAGHAGIAGGEEEVGGYEEDGYQGHYQK